MRRATGIAVALALAAALPARGADGSAPTPDPFERQLTRYREFLDYGGYEASVEGLLPKGFVSRWKLSAGLGATYTDNLDQDARREEAWWAHGSLGVGWVRRTPRLLGTADYRFRTGLYESTAIEQRNTTRQSLVGGLRWQASPRLTTFVSGHATQNLEEPIGGGLSGVAAGYRNRSDEYSLSGGYTWRLAASVVQDASYGFSYRNYVSDAATGEDTRSHQASAGLAWGRGRAGRWRLRYGYARQEEVSSGGGRQNHTGSVGWSRTFLPLADPRPTTVGLDYSVDRGLPYDGNRYWNHSWSISIGRSWSPRTSTSARVGYQWVVPEDGKPERSVTWGVDAGHRFTEYTKVSLGASEGWSYQPATSRTSFTRLTKTRRVNGSISTRWGRSLTSRLSASVVDARVQGGEGVHEDDYWETTALAEVSAKMGRDGFWGTGYRFSRRMADRLDDRFQRHRWNGFMRWSLGRVWDARVTLIHDRRTYDAVPDRDYHENRITASLNAAW